MKVNVYYGGRGLLEDPTLFVVEKIIQVLQELRVEVTRYIVDCNTSEYVEGLRWRDSGSESGMVWHWRLYAAVSGYVLAVW